MVQRASGTARIGRAAAILLVAVVGCALVAVAQAGPSAGVKVTLSAPTHSPRLGVKWFYSVRATVGGKPVAGRVTAQIVDPIGGVHPVEFAATKQAIAARPFRGVFRDYVLWTAESRGVPLTFRVTVVAAGAKKTIAYRVTPRS